MFKVILHKFDLIPERGKEKSPLYLLLAAFTFILAFLLDKYIYPDTILVISYIPFVIVTGFIFRHSISILAVSGISTGLVLVGSDISSWTTELFLLRWFGYFFLALVIKIMVNRVQSEREHIVNLTSTLAETIDARDKYTSFHSKNVATYSLQIAKAMGLPKKQCNHIYIGGLLHDIGKIGVPEAILNKPSKLTNEEFEVIKKHPVIGYNVLKFIPFFKYSSILDMVLYHHERFDGKGYPKGLVGDDIPLVARIMAVADSFDAMTSRRIYRNKLDLEYTLNEFRTNKNKQFDEKIVDTFLELVENDDFEILSQEKSRKHGDGSTAFTSC